MAKLNVSLSQELLDLKNRQDNAYTNKAINEHIKSINSANQAADNDSKVASGIMVSTNNGGTVQDISINGSNRLLNSIQSIASQYANNSEALQSIRSYDSQTITTGQTLGRMITPDDNSVEVVEPTVVESDPEQPLPEETFVESTTDSNSFNIAHLYTNNDLIDVTRSKYRDINRAQDIRPQDLISISNQGLITQHESTVPEELSSYRLIPSDYLMQHTVPEKNEFTTMPLEPYPRKPFNEDKFHYADINSETLTQQRILYRYSYGFDKVVLAQHKINTTAAYLSPIINVNDCDYIELFADVFDNIEYSIIDGKVEVPILPIDQQTIKQEKLFYGLMPRFDIMNPNDITVYRNGEIFLGVTSLGDLQLLLSVNNTNEEISQSLFLRNDIFTIDYEPNPSARIYYPRNTKIRVKIVQRVLSEDTVPEPITNVMIRKYGISKPWTLSSYDNAEDYEPEDIRNW